MKRTIWGSLVILGILTAIMRACAPATPLPSPAPAPQAAPAAPALSPEEADWAKVVEAAKKEGKVNAYSYSWVGDIGLAVSRAFREKYGISLEIVTGRGAEFTERIRTEKRMGRQVADVTQTSPLFTNAMKSAGLLASVAGELPALREKGIWRIEPAALDPQDKANLIDYLSVHSPYINTKLVRADDIPRSWTDLLDPKWRGKMSLTEPSTGGTYQVIVVFLESKIWNEGYIKALYEQKLRFYTAMQDEYPALARGEVHLMIRGSDGTAARFAMEGAHIQAIDMKEGLVLSSGNVAAIAGGPNPNAARVFLNWMFSQEGQTLVGRAQGVQKVRKDVPDFRPRAVQTPVVNALLQTVEHLEKATQMLRERWFDKLVGR